MKFKVNLKDNNSIHFKDLIDEICSIYAVDDIKDFRYADVLDESAEENTIPPNVIFDKDDVEAVLKYIKNCSVVFVAPRPQNLKFIGRNKLKPEDVKDILNQLTYADYVKNIESITSNKNNRGNNLMIFKKMDVLVKGNPLPNGLGIYIKLDLDESTETAVVAVSFHETY